MKLSVLTFGLLLSLANLANAYQIQNLTSIKTQDGLVAKCETRADYDFLKNRGAYQLVNIFAFVVENRQLILNMNVISYKCSNESGSWGFVKINANDSLQYFDHDLLIDSKPGLVTIERWNSRLQAYFDKGQNYSQSEEYKTENDLLTLSFPISNLLSEQDISQIEQGTTLRSHFYVDNIVNVQAKLRGGIDSRVKAAVGGSFMIRLDLKKESGNIKVYYVK